MADIELELDTISHDVVGAHVKKAIHDALDKVNKDDAPVEYEISPACIRDVEPISH